MTYYSQYKQDKFLEENIFRGFKNGVFVDVGAHDGRSFNNTLFFEESRQWTGINIEPLPDVYKRLVENRPNSTNLCCAASDEDGSSEFITNSGYVEMLSGILKHYDQRHKQRLKNEIKDWGGQTSITVVPTKRLESILDEHNIRHIHYLSIDVEGAEFAVIRGINFDKVFIDVIEFENNYTDTSIPIIEFLKSKGYEVFKVIDIDIIMIHKNSAFLKRH